MAENGRDYGKQIAAKELIKVLAPTAYPFSAPVSTP